MILDTSIKCYLVYYNKEGELPFNLHHLTSFIHHMITHLLRFLGPSDLLTSCQPTNAHTLQKTFFSYGFYPLRREFGLVPLSSEKPSSIFHSIFSYAFSINIVNSVEPQLNFAQIKDLFEIFPCYFVFLEKNYYRILYL